MSEWGIHFILSYLKQLNSGGKSLCGLLSDGERRPGTSAEAAAKGFAQALPLQPAPRLENAFRCGEPLGSALVCAPLVLTRPPGPQPATEGRSGPDSRLNGSADLDCKT